MSKYTILSIQIDDKKKNALQFLAEQLTSGYVQHLDKTTYSTIDEAKENYIKTNKEPTGKRNVIVEYELSSDNKIQITSLIIPNEAKKNINQFFDEQDEIDLALFGDNKNEPDQDIDRFRFDPPLSDFTYTEGILSSSKPKILKLEDSTEFIEFRKALDQLKIYASKKMSIDKEKSEVAIGLAFNLETVLTKFLMKEKPDEKSYNQFKQEFLDTLYCKDIEEGQINKFKVLSAHRSYKVLIANIAIALIPLAGPIAVIAKMAHSYHKEGKIKLFFDHKTKGQNTVENIEEKLDSIKPSK